LDKNQPNGERHIQQFRTILVSDVRLRSIVWNEAKEAEIERIRIKKEESKCKKEEYVEGVASRKVVRLEKKAEKAAEKVARIAQLAQIIADNP
jgi:hypothetical protein